MREDLWIAWEIQTSRKWTDMDDVLKLTNIDFIDHDHIQLVQFALKLNQVLERSQTEFSMALLEETKGLIEDLLSYARAHFTREEQFMDQYRLPNIAPHKREHQHILKFLEASKEDFEGGKSKLTAQFKAQVMDWLLQHINVVDVEFFKLENWKENIVNAADWKELKPIIGLTGIAEIDHQHEELTDITIEGMERLSRNPAPELVRSVINDIREFAKGHFSWEEEFIKKYEIKNTSAHMKEHQRFMTELDAYEQSLIDSEKNIIEMKEWIIGWWVEHINTTDHACFDYKNWAYHLMDRAKEPEEVSVLLRRTGVGTIDEEHLHLMTLTFKLNQLVENHCQWGVQPSEEVKTMILNSMKEIYEFAEKHFQGEEQLMEERKMEDLVSHRAEHHSILEKLKKMEENYRTGRLLLSSNLKTLLLDWWIQHTNNTDYRTFVQRYKQAERKAVIL